MLRPATIKSFELNGAGKNVVVLKHEGETRTITAGWVADCSGKASLVARQRGTWKKLEDHPVHSMWVRYTKVMTLDSHEARVKAPCLKDGPSVARASATNQLMGRGWWSWIIPLSNGDFSAGLRMKVVPQATANGIIHKGIIAGKLNGGMPTTTPSGSRMA